MLKLDFDTRALDAKLDKITKAASGGVRPAAQEGAQILYERARAEAPRSGSAHNFNIEGRVYGPFSPGTLRDSIYQVFSKSNSGYGKATYHISFNHTKAPYGFMVLRGTSRLPANDFIGRAYDGAMRLAASTALERLAKLQTESSHLPTRSALVQKRLQSWSAKWQPAGIWMMTLRPVTWWSWKTSCPAHWAPCSATSMQHCSKAAWETESHCSRAARASSHRS